MHESPEVRPSISLDRWLQSPVGRYALAWEQARLDREVADIFGFHALQLGMPALMGLRHNRMPHRWLARDVGEPGVRGEDGIWPGRAALMCDFADLPFSSQSLDLVVLPHALEVASDAHACLREVDRVLVAGGQVVLTGFNPLSLWRARQAAARLGGDMFLPQHAEFLSPRRIRDWLRLLSFEVTGGAYGCWRPPVRSERWLERWRFMDQAGDRWWPIAGAVYMLVATKRVRAMRLVGKVWDPASAPATAARPLIHHRNPDHFEASP